MKTAQAGNTVRIHYTGRLGDGTQFDSSEGRDPLEFTLGSGQVIPGFDTGVTGMSEGEQKTITIPCDEAYGPSNPQLIQDVARSDIPESIPLHVGAQLTASDQNGQQMQLTVTALNDETVTLDANHRLAGEDLTFDLELVEVVG